MSDPASGSDSSKLDRVIADFIEATERGEKPDRDALLAAHADIAVELQKFFNDYDHLGVTNLQPMASSDSYVIPDEFRKPGVMIAGRYKLLENIGEGGMGSVWVAEQKEPVKRRVAIKLIKAGMDSKQVLARFEAERQALALMDHPHIAKVLDAGTDEKGRPYFVMEYVKGKPITSYADKQQLSIAERLGLVEQVCQAVQHAHHKGVIHRDLKPSNILVSTVDGQPFAKVIDFGIAKAIGHQLTDKTIFTLHDQFVGTPQYMSPEQAEGSLDIDTRTDVYSLGVLLYELLTGSPPFSAAELKQAAWEQLRKKVMEVDPPKPSTRLSESGEILTTLATSRKTEPKRLGALVRGELDWIVMKALEKDRKRRYETPTSLANDIQSHLKGEAIQAAPPSKLYQLQKLLRRHKGPVATIAAVMLALLLGIAGTAFGLRHAQIANGELESYANKLQNVFGQWYAETNRKAWPGPGGDGKRDGSSEARLAGGFRIHVDYADGAPQVRTWIEEGANMHAARMQVAEDLGEALLYEYRTREATMRDLEISLKNTEQVLARGILRPLGTSVDNLINQAEVTSFMDWSRIDEFRLRQMIVEVAFQNPEDALRLSLHPGRVIHAVCGIDPHRRQTIRRWLLEKQRDQSQDVRCRVAACLLSLEVAPVELPALQETLTWSTSQSPEWFDRTTSAVSRHIDQLSPSDIVVAWDTLTDLLSKSMDIESRLSKRQFQLEQIAPVLPERHLHSAMKAILDLLDTPRSREAVSVLQVLIRRLDPEQIRFAGDVVIAKVGEISRGDNSSASKTDALDALFAIMRYLPADQTQQGWAAFLQAPERHGEWYFSEFIDGAMESTDQLSESQAEHVADSLFSAVTNLKIIEEGLRLRELNQVAIRIAPRLTTKKREAYVDLLLEGLQYSEEIRLHFCAALVATASVLPPDELTRLRAGALQALQRLTADGAISIGATGMTGLVQVLSREEIQTWRRLPIHVIEQSKESWERSEAWSTVIALLRQLGAETDPTFIDEVLNVIDPDKMKEDELGQVILALASKVSADQAKRAWDMLIPMLDKEGYSSENPAAEALVMLVPQLADADLQKCIDEVEAILLKSDDGYAIGPTAWVLSKLKLRSPNLSLDEVTEKLVLNLERSGLSGYDAVFCIGVTDALVIFAPTVNKEKWRPMIKSCCNLLFLAQERYAAGKLNHDFSVYYVGRSDAIRNVVALIDSPTDVAALLRHPTCVDTVQEVVLTRFEECVLNEGRPYHMRNMSNNFYHDRTPANPRPDRQFRTLDDAVAWIAANWPDFDLEKPWSDAE